MTTYNRNSGRSMWRAMVGCVFTGALALSVSSVPARAQSVGSGTGLGNMSDYYTSDYSLVEPCYTDESDSCMLVAAFNSDSYSYWYENNGSSNGIGGIHIFFYVNGVYDATYDANGTTNPGAITVLGVPGTTYTFQGTEADGTCSNDAYYQQGFTAYYTTAEGKVYTLGIPYTC